MKVMISVLLMITMIGFLTACASGGDQTGQTSDDLDTKEVEEVTTEAIEEVTTEGAPVYDNLYPTFILAEDDTTVTYLNQFGDATTMTKNPKKVVVTYNSLLGLWYYMGGESMTKVKGSTNVPEEAMDLMDLGSSSSISLEAIVALEPDMVLISGNIESNVAMAPSLEEMGIETMIIDAKTKSYQAFAENAYLFSKVLGTEALYNEKTAHVLEDVAAIIALAETSSTQPRVAPLFATSKSISMETDLAQVGEMVTLLGGKNILPEETLMGSGETRIPFSIEALITQNPEVILISTMGDVAAAQGTIDGMIEENPVWAEVEAVKNNRVFYLDKNLSVYKPNERYNEAFMMVAEMLYPSLFPVE